jgi:RimJ/RimL family protein N-acetyltransferase
MTIPNPLPERESAEKPEIITIRPAEAGDWAAYREIRLEALRLHPDAFASDYTVNLNEPPEFWQERIKSTPDKSLFFAARGTDLLGMAGISRHPSPKTRHSGLIWGVYVRPQDRGRDLAQHLLQACLDWAVDYSLVVVKLAVVTTNIRAIACYARCGFRVYGIEPRMLFVNGVYYDELLMVHHLSTD